MLLVLLLGRPGVAFAEPTKGEIAAARALFAEGEADEQAGRWADALSKIRRASTVKMTPGIRFHIAVCEEKLAQLVPALDDYAAAQAAAQRENNQEVLDLVAEPLAALKARVPTLKLNVPLGVTGTVVEIDGAPLASGLWGTAVPVESGAHRVQARATGKVTYETTVSVVPRDHVSVDVAFADAPVAPTVAAVVAAAPPPQDSGARRPSRTLAIAATASAVVLVAGGIGAFAAAGGDQSTAQTQCNHTPGPPPCTRDQTAIRTLDAVALTAWIAGGAVGTAAVILWTRPASSEHPAHAEMGVGPGSLFIRGAF